MKIAFFRALIAGLLLVTAPVFNNELPAQYNQQQYNQQQYNQQQYNQQQYNQQQYNQPLHGQPQYGQPQHAQSQFNLSQSPYPNNYYPSQVRIPRYPLIQANPNAAGFTPSPGYIAPNQQQVGIPNQAANRNLIQQPQFYSGQGSQPVPRVFSPGSPAPGSNQMMVPQVANNYGYQDRAPSQDTPDSPSNLPIPGSNNNPQKVEQLQQGNGVPPLAHPQIQHGNQQQHQQIAPHHQGPYPQPGHHVHPHVDNSGYAYPQAGVTTTGPVNGSNCNGFAGGCGIGGGFNGGFGNGFNAGFGGFGYGGGCGFIPPARTNPGMWFGSLGGLVFNRDYEDDHAYAYPLGFPTTNSLVTTDADVGAIGGMEASFGRRFCNGAGFEVVYWGLFSEDGIATASGGNPQTNWHTANYIDYNVSTMDVYLNAALAYRLRRTNQFHNIELNFFRQTFTGASSGGGFGVGAGMGAGGYGLGGRGGAWGGRPFGANCGQGCGIAGNGLAGCNSCGNAGCNSCGNGCGPAMGGYGARGLGAGGLGARGCGPALRPIRPRNPFRIDLLAGVRFFRFDENLFFQASTTGDYSPNINDMHYDIDVDNNLIGLQFGGNVEYCLFPKLTLVGGTRFGIYGNSISQRQRIYGLAGYAVPNVGSWAGQDFNQRSTKTDIAFLGQLDLGLRYAMNCRWGLGFGYRVISVSGVALAPEQIPYDFSDYQEVNYINSNGGLILHGAYLRAQYNY